MALRLAAPTALVALSRPLLAMHIPEDKDAVTSGVIVDSAGGVVPVLPKHWGLTEQADLEAFRAAVDDADDGVPVSEEYLAQENQADALTGSWFGHQRFSLKFEPLDEGAEEYAKMSNNLTKGGAAHDGSHSGGESSEDDDHVGGNSTLSDKDPTPWEKYYNRDICLKQREPDAKSNYFVWCQLDKPIIYSKKYNFAYMKTPKAASTAFFAYFNKMFPDSKEINKTELPEDAYIFTFVRRPFEQKLSAFAEVDLKEEVNGGYGKKQGTTFQDVPKSKNQGRDRFAAFLDDLEQRRFEQYDKRMPSHAASQIAGVLCTRKVNFIGHLERATIDWEQIQRDAKLPHKIRSKAVPIVHEGENPGYKFDEHVPLNTSLKEKICSMYRSDFACLGYAAPEQCDKFHLKP